MDRQIFLVTADHKVPRYSFTQTLVRVSEDAYDHTFYADHPELGCGKCYRSPQDAILGLFQDHACFNIKIEEEEEYQLCKGNKEDHM